MDFRITLAVLSVFLIALIAVNHRISVVEHSLDGAIQTLVMK
jgi:hypothetical protein